MLKLIQKLRKDKGDAVLVTTIIAIPLFMMAFYFSVGLAMNAWTKTSFSDSAQASAQAAAADISSAGYLDAGSVGTMVSEYMRLTGRTAGTAAQVANGGYGSTEAKVFTCNTVEVAGATYASPYMEISLDRTRATGTSDADSPLYTSAGGATPTAVFTINSRVNYRVISATVYEASTSLLGDGFAMLGEDSGCYTSMSQVSGITFGANEDLSVIGGDAACWIPSTPTDITDAVMKTTGSIKLYSGADYTCPVVAYLNSPYVLTTHEYGSFYKISYGGADYWINNLDVRPPNACTDRNLSDRKTAVTPAQYSTAGATDVKAYSAPFPDCKTTDPISGEVTVVARYNGPFGNYYQLSDGRWANQDQLKAMRTVVFASNGGVGGGTVRIHDGGTINAFASPTRTGYIFAGWYTASSGGAKVSFPRAINNNVTYYAQWATSSYSITYNGAGGNLSGCSPATYNVTSGAVTPNCSIKTRSGYTFTGLSPSTIPAGSIGNKTVTAQWSIITYKISYAGNGGSVPSYCGPTSYNVTSGNIAPTCTPTRTNYEFINWSPSNIAPGSTGDKIFTAQWSLRQYTVKFDSRGGTGYGDQYIKQGSQVNQNNPAKSGWSFRGWATTATSGATPNARMPQTVTADITFYAHWQRTNTTSYNEPAIIDVYHDTTETVRVYAHCARGNYDGSGVRAYVWGRGGSGWSGWAYNNTRIYVYNIVNYWWGAPGYYGWSGQGGWCSGTTSSIQYD